MPPVRYAEDVAMGTARAAYFAANGFGEGGYEDAWVKLQAGPIPIYLPDSPQRVRAVRLHDLQALTGYDTTWTGEGEIAAWGIGSSCADHYAAFVRGRHSGNLDRTPFDESLLQPMVRDMRHELALDQSAAMAGGSDVVAFGVWSVLSVTTLVTTASILCGPFVAIAAYVAR